MTQEEQQKAFESDLRKLVNHYAHEFDLTYSSIVGALELEKATLINELLNPELYKDDE